MAGLRPLFLGFLLAGLFIFSIITGMIMLGNNNNASQNIGDDPILTAYKDDIEDTLNTAQTNSNSSLEALGDSPVTVIPGSFVIDAIAGIWKTLKVVPVTIYNLTAGLFKVKIFGDGFNVVIGILSAILIMIIIFGVIKLVSQGQDK